MDQVVLIFAPHGRDAAVAAQVLAQAKISTAVCADAGELLARIDEGASAVLLTEEALAGPQTLDRLDTALGGQPPWSSLPVVVLRSERAPNGPDRLVLRLSGHQGVIFLQRPVSMASLASVLRAALATRVRQYRMRDLMEELSSLNANLETRVEERTALALQRAEQLRELSSELLLAEEREQRRFAELLHDDLQQLLMAASLNVRVLLMAKDPAKKDEYARDIEEILDRSGKATRSLTVELNAPVLYERGLAAALQWLAEEMGKQHGAEITVCADGKDNPSTNDLRVFFFRAVRELLLNTVKYSKGSAVAVTMSREESSVLRVVVADEGPGFDPATLARRGGFGLANIRHRAGLLGGELHIDSAPGKGTRMTLSAPLPL